MLLYRMINHIDRDDIVLMVLNIDETMQHSNV